MNKNDILIDLELLNMGSLIRLKRCYDRLTLDRLSEMIGIGPTSLSEVENSKRILPWKYREKMNRYLYEMRFVDGILQEGE